LFGVKFSYFRVIEQEFEEFAAQLVRPLLQRPHVPQRPAEALGGIKDSDSYGNFNLVDKTGSVYVYGVLPGWGSPKGKFQEIGVAEGDTLTIVGYRTSYNGTDEGGGGFFISKKSPTSTTPDTPETPDASEYSIDLAYTLGSSAYDDGAATINEVSVEKTLKIGTSKKAGDFTLTVPAGTKSLTFYAVAWKEKATTLEFYSGDTLLGEQAIADNDGATGNAPYTITVADTDKYTFTYDFAAETQLKVTTKSGENTRAIFFGIKAN